MTTIELVTRIAAPRERCFDLARSIELHEQTTSHTGERAVAGKTSGLLELDDQVTWRARHFGIWQRLTGRISAYDRPRHFQDVMLHGAFKRLRHDHYFEDAGESTIMRDVMQFSAPLGPLGWLAERAFLAAYMRRFLEARNGALKLVAESGEWTRYVSTTLVLIMACLSLAACQPSERKAPVAAQAGTDSPRSSPPACDEATVTGSGIGVLRIGTPVDSVRARCRIVRDTIERRAEGQPSRVITVLVGEDSVEAEVDSGRVWRIEVTRASPRTADSLGVGTPLSRLLELPDVRATSGEGGAYLQSPARCGLSFQLSAYGPGGLRAEWSAAALRRFPPATVVRRLLIVGCPA
jgi:ligand-binding SRPBCC domain-containing protein